MMPAGVVDVARGTAGGWTYPPPGKSDTFDLRLRMGWDPSLVYHGTAASGTWAFEPGDGSPERTIVLNP